MNTLAESKQFLIFNEFEEVYLLEKALNHRLSIGSHYADPVLAIISPDEKWFLSAGEGVQYYDPVRGSHHFFSSGFKAEGRNNTAAFIHAARVQSPNTVKVLLDPWSSYASTWSLCIKQLKVAKICNGPSLAGKPYTDTVHY